MTTHKISFIINQRYLTCSPSLYLLASIIFPSISHLHQTPLEGLGLGKKVRQNIIEQEQ